MQAYPVKATSIRGREILDSRGFPTLEVDLTLETIGSSLSAQGRASVPSGASTGSQEAHELRDHASSRYQGKGVLFALDQLHTQLQPLLLQTPFQNQEHWDDFLCKTDGTPQKTRLGANLLLALSLAFLKASAKLHQSPQLASWIAQNLNAPGTLLPVPCLNLLNGGKHANQGLCIQEMMIIPLGFPTFSKALQAGAETFHALKNLLLDQHFSTAVGDEGGFAPGFSGPKPHEQALNLLMKAIRQAGYQPGKEIYLALDVAASSFFNESSYHFEKESYQSNDLIALYQDWQQRYPLLSIEDGLAETDWKGWKQLTQRLGQRCQLVGDDLFVTQTPLLQKGIQEQVANSILIKLNQVGTVSETFKTLTLAQKAGFTSIISHRSGETEDHSIADLAVGSHAGQIKAGSTCRTDRLAKYNQLLRLEEQLGSKAQFAGFTPYQSWL